LATGSEKGKNMSTNQLANLRRSAIGGLLAGAIGIVILKLSGVEMPVVPPGVVLLILAAALVGTVRRRWAAAFAAVVGLAELGGFFASGSAANLFETESIGVFTGTWIRLLGVVVATLAGAWVTLHRVPNPPQTARAPSR
jgi:hypothetical protein